MASDDDVQLLVDFGIFNSEGLSRLANLIRGVQALSGGVGGGVVSRSATAPQARRGRPPGAVGRPRGRPGRPKAAAAAPSTNGASTRKRGPRATFTASGEELAKLKAQGMTAKAMAEKFGVSAGTINLHLKKHGLTSPRGRPAGKAPALKK